MTLPAPDEELTRELDGTTIGEVQAWWHDTTTWERACMKTMTCKQLGGPCDFPHRGQTADEVIKAQDQHLKDVVAKGDATHESALKEMKGRWRHPLSGMGWYRKAKRDFAALPED